LKLFEQNNIGDLPDNHRVIDGFHDINENIIPGVTRIFEELYLLEDNDENLICCSKIGQHYDNCTIMNFNTALNIRTNLFAPKPSIKIDFKKYFKEDYETIIVGISDDRFVEFYHCKIIFNISKDLF
jgi:hypothetical protein